MKTVQFVGVIDHFTGNQLDCHKTSLYVTDSVQDISNFKIDLPVSFFAPGFLGPINFCNGTHLSLVISNTNCLS